MGNWSCFILRFTILLLWQAVKPRTKSAGNRAKNRRLLDGFSNANTVLRKCVFNIASYYWFFLYTYIIIYLYNQWLYNKLYIYYIIIYYLCMCSTWPSPWQRASTTVQTEWRLFLTSFGLWILLCQSNESGKSGLFN